MSELPPSDEPPPLSETEIRNEINSLTAGERAKLLKIASYYVWKGRIGNKEEESGELVQEAICRVLAGAREWRRDLEKIRFLAGVIKSIAGDRKRDLMRALKRTVPLSGEKKEVGDLRRRGTFDHEGAEARGILAKIDVTQIINVVFEDDDIAQKMLVAMARGEDLQQTSGLSPTEYESKRKKIRRRIEKLKT